MNKNVVIVVFLALFIFMLLDLIFQFPMLVKGIFYGGSFIVGTFIYYFNYYKPHVKESEEPK